MTTTYLAKDRFNHAIQALSPSTTQTVSISGVSAVTPNILNRHTVVIRVLATTSCFINIGAGTPTANSTHMPIAANIPEYFRVDAAPGIRVAGVQISASGSLYVTEMN